MRNLSFRCDEAALRKAFEAHGAVTEVRVPFKPDGKHPGFGFVQMGTRAESTAALAALNETKIVGRVVAVDFALSKHHFEKQLRQELNDAKWGAGRCSPREKSAQKAEG